MAWRTSKTNVKIAAMQRRENIRADILNGLSNQIALAVRHGVNQQTISRDIAIILGEMREEDKQMAKAELLVALNRVEDNYREASNAWQRSKKNKEEITTDYYKKTCKECKGTGMLEGDEESQEWCPVCQGDGFILQEKVTRKTTGQAGDPTFLRERRELIKFRCFLLGIGAPKEPQEPIVQNNTIVNLNMSKVSREKVVQALRAIDQLKEEKLKAEVLDVEYEPAGELR